MAGKQSGAPKKHFWIHPISVALVTMIITTVGLSGIYKFMHRSRPTMVQTVEMEVSRDIFLPSGETPTLAVVTNQSKLESSLKLVAKTGDDILIFEKQSEAIVYRPSAHRIVAVLPVLLGAQPNPDVTTSIAVLNGSGSNMKEQDFITALYKLYPNLNLVYKATAPRVFPTTIVYGPNAGDSEAAAFAQALHIQAGQAPLGVPDNIAPITFIIGQDYTPVSVNMTGN